MAITLVGSTNFYSTDTNGFTSGAVDTSGATFIAVWYAGGANGGSYTLSDSKSNTWTGLTKTDAFFGTRVGQWLYAYNATVGSGHTFTITGSSSAPTLQVLWYSGVLTSDPFDTGQQSGASSNGATTIQAGSVTPSENNCVVLSGLYVDNSRSPSIDGGFTKEQETTNTDFGHFYGAAADLIQTTATAANPTWTISSSDIVISRNAVFKSSGGGGGGSVVKDMLGPGYIAFAR